MGHIIHVSALEGKFSVGRKGSGHPHTNMAKVSPPRANHPNGEP